MRGHIRKRRNRYAVVIETETNTETSKRGQSWFSHRILKEADVHLANLLSQIHGGGIVPTHKLKTEEFLEQGLSDYA